ncbi:MAG TPA: ribbon-helix-helix protein, CopG family [Polyangiaceae bacterium]|nr:ribbon-helix-helix protein, CopG family [Polyangiaceae bacterium]
MTTARRSVATTRKAHDPQPSAPLQRPKRLTGGPRLAPRSPSIVERKDGRHLRRMTVYLPPDMHKRLALYCVEQERDMSDVIREALLQHLPRARA